MKHNRNISINTCLTVFIGLMLFGPLRAGIINLKSGDPVNQAVSLAQPGDTLILQTGFYYENGIVVDRPLTIIGDAGATIACTGKKDLILVQSDNVEITGLILQSVPVSFIDDNAAIKLDDVKNVRVYNCTFEDNFFAVYLARCEQVEILNNEIRAYSSRESQAGNGIHLWYCRDVDVRDNRVNGHRDGIYFEFVKDSRIVGNICVGNLRYGLHFMFSDHCLYKGNTFENNGAGVAVMYTEFVTMQNNTFQKNWGSAAYGLLLKDITDSEISGNLFLENSIGIHSDACNRLQIFDNTFTGNGWAMRIMANSLENHVFRNNFIDNTFDVSTNSRHSFNHFENNYWSAYRGYDLDRDGIGDTPHHPVRMFSFIVQDQPTAIILMRSLFVDMLDIAERVFPIITPETLVDQKPLMVKQ